MANDSWKYPEKPTPDADCDEWAAWYEEHIEYLESENARLRGLLKQSRQLHVDTDNWLDEHQELIDADAGMLRQAIGMMVHDTGELLDNGSGRVD